MNNHFILSKHRMYRNIQTIKINNTYMTSQNREQQNKDALQKFNNENTPHIVGPPFFNILIRNTYRPSTFPACIESILMQTYKSYRIIMCYDDDNCLEYLSPYMEYSNITIFKVEQSIPPINYFYNLYMNELLREVKEGWILFLDDDDKFVENRALEYIKEQITSTQDFIMWKLSLKVCDIYPLRFKEVLENKINKEDSIFNQIVNNSSVVVKKGWHTSMICFNSLFKDLSKWYARSGSDFIYSLELIKSNSLFQQKIINHVLTGLNHDKKGNKGAKELPVIRGFQEFIQLHCIRQIYISPTLLHLKPRVISMFNLKDYHDTQASAIFFGIYSHDDKERIMNHQGLTYVMFGGSDVQLYTSIKPSTICVAISENIAERLGKRKHIRVHFNIVDRTLFKPLIKLGSKIFIYDGLVKHQINNNKYGKKYYDKVVRRLPQYKYIFSSGLGVPYEKMPEIYAQCFIGLRLTSNDGNANMAQEMTAMNIPVVHNFSESGLKWKNVDDIVMWINKYDASEKRFVNQSDTSGERLIDQSGNYLDMYKKNNFTQADLNHINTIITHFIHDIKSIIPSGKILFLCGDKPGYGGAATNCYKLQQFFKTEGYDTYGFYFPYEKTETIYKEDYCIAQLSQLEATMHRFNPDLIIVRSMAPKDITKYNIPIVFIVPGLYKNDLSKYYYTLTPEEHNTYVNNQVFQLMKVSTMIYVNSRHTQELLKTHHNISTRIFYAQCVPYYNKQMLTDDKFQNRKYQYGLIVSNFNRKIKNIETSIQFLKDKDNVILIGKNSSMYKDYGFECVDLVDYDKMDSYYRQIKYIVQDSYYESCSNVKIEGLFNGCRMKPVIVISSTQYAGYGGAATNAYQLIKHFREQGFNVAGVFFHNTLDVDYDPDSIGGIFLYGYKYDATKVHSEVIDYLHADPTLCLAKNYLAPQFCKEIFRCFTTYLVSGINHFRLFFPEKNALEILDDSFKFIDDYKFAKEIKTLDIVDLAINNSKLSNDIFVKCYPQYRDKIYDGYVDTTASIYKMPLLEKKYDIIIACSKLIRKNKNNMFLIDLLKQPIFNLFNKIIIGNNNAAFKDIPNSIVLNLQYHKNSVKLLNQSRILLFPSLFDSNSNTVREAYYHKCLPLITRNIGYNELFPDYLICDNFTISEWTSKLNYLLHNYEELKDTKIKYDEFLNIEELL